MDEAWLRLALVGGALAIVALVVWLMRRRDQRLGKSFDVEGLSEGVYFFSSTTCDSCRDARKRIEQLVGSEGYTEYAWETAPDMFSDVGVEAVPATLVVFSSGKAELHNGAPESLRLTNGP